MMGFPEDSGVGKAGLAEGWNRLMLSRGGGGLQKAQALASLQGHLAIQHSPKGTPR